MPDIFDEVEEDLRAERLRALLSRYSGVLLGAALLAVAGVAGWQGWRWWQARQDQAASARYIAAMNAAAATGPVAKLAHQRALAQFLALVRTAPAGYRTLARMQAAGLEVKAGHLPQALALWDQVAADPEADPALRGLASLYWADHQLDRGDPGIVAARLKALAVPGGPWRLLAEQDLALLDLRQGRTAAARKRLTGLVRDAKAPPAMRRQAAALLAGVAG